MRETRLLDRELAGMEVQLDILPVLDGKRYERADEKSYE